MTTLIAAIVVGFAHTLLGPDHYLPFVAIGRARRWSLTGTLLLTAICGLAHVLSSVAVGLFGVAGGRALGQLEAFEGTRGSLAGIALLLFGAGYLIWGLWLARRDRPHAHPHLHSDGTLHHHAHHHPGALLHGRRHRHGHEQAGATPSPDSADASPATWRSLTPWLLFVIFALGPCEPLIPLFFAAALGGDWIEVILAILGYGAATIAAMLATVSLLWVGLRPRLFDGLARYGHAAAGLVLLLSGAAISLGL